MNSKNIKILSILIVGLFCSLISFSQNETSIQTEGPTSRVDNDDNNFTDSNNILIEELTDEITAEKEELYTMIIMIINSDNKLDFGNEQILIETIGSSNSISQFRTLFKQETFNEPIRVIFEKQFYKLGY